MPTMMNMNTKLILLVLVAVLSLSSTCSALVTPPSSSASSSAFNSNSNSRRTFLSKAPATAAALIVATGAATANPTLANAETEDGEYKFYVAPPVVEKKESSGKLLVGGALFGSVALSLPFFLPNLMRMAGVKNAKTPTATSKNDRKKKK
jgi:hypothetical protein